MVTHQVFDHEACLSPCENNHINVDETLSLHTDEHDFVELRTHPEVEITRHTDNYDLFDLTVEVGSALGLWCGLSLLGACDILLDLCFKCKKLTEKIL